MRTLKLTFAVLAGAALAVTLVAPTRGQGLQDVSRKTTVKITSSMEVPGRVLPPGTYIFEVMDIVGTRDIMRITNADDGKVIATIIAVPDYRVKPGDKAVVQYKEEPAGRPTALRAWFYAGERAGLEFVYPRHRAVELAQASNEVVPAEVTEATENNLTTVPLTAVTPQGKEEPVAKAIETTPAPTEVAQALPKTASLTPLIALLGGLLVAAGFGLKTVAKAHS